MKLHWIALRRLEHLLTWIRPIGLHYEILEATYDHQHQNNDEPGMALNGRPTQGKEGKQMKQHKQLSRRVLSVSLSAALALGMISPAVWPPLRLILCMSVFLARTQTMAPKSRR